MADYDVIVVGARCAGAALAMLLARKSHRVLGLDRADFPSDTLSTHFMPPRADRSPCFLGPTRPPRQYGMPTD